MLALVYSSGQLGFVRLDKWRLETVLQWIWGLGHWLRSYNLFFLVIQCNCFLTLQTPFDLSWVNAWCEHSGVFRICFWP